MDDVTSRYRGRLMPPRHDGSGDPAIAGLTELIGMEFERAELEEPALVQGADPGRVWLLWFAIGATDAVCDLAGRQTEVERDAVFRQVVGTIFKGEPVRSQVDPVQADQRLIELFESAGAEAVLSCIRRDRRLGYYLEALRVSQVRRI